LVGVVAASTLLLQEGGSKETKELSADNDSSHDEFNIV
jgi:hypothetical protein